MKNFSNQKKKGFTIIEVVTAMAIFTMMIVAFSSAFASSFFGYRNSMLIQKDLEEAQYAANLMAKSLRTSSIIGCGNGNTPGSCDSSTKYTLVRVYDYSQGLCIDYKINNGIIENDYVSLNSREDCANQGSMSGAPLTSNKVFLTGNSSFYVSPSTTGSPAKVGRVTIFFELCPAKSGGGACASNSNEQTRIQTSVSLRDYTVTGIR